MLSAPLRWWRPARPELKLGTALLVSSAGFGLAAATLPLRMYLCAATSNDELVADLRESGAVRSAEVEQAMQAIDRANFVRDHDRGLAYVDAPQPIGYGATISAPHMHATCLELLRGRLQPGARVLDVGSGSGYLAAVLCELQRVHARQEAGPQRQGGGADGGAVGGRVVGIEHIAELQQWALENMGRDHHTQEMIQSEEVQLVVGDGRLGWEEAAPYDAIHVGAAAPSVPEPLVRQLKPGGLMVVPVGPEGGVQTLACVEKRADGSVEEHDTMGVCYVPLTSREHQVSPSPPGSP